MKLKKLLFMLVAMLLMGSTSHAASSKTNVLFIGDSRTVGLKEVYSDLDSDTYIKKNFKVSFVAKVGAGYNDYFISSGCMRSSMYDALDKLNKKDDPKCIIWLGVNDCGYNDRPEAYATAINKLAKSYKNIDFTVAMPTGVDESYYNKYVTNSIICNFDSKYLSALKDTTRYGKNLHVCKMYNKFKGEIKGNTVDGLHYKAKFSKKLMRYMLDSVEE